MTNWTLEKKDRWYLCADGKEMTICNNEDEAQLLLGHILKNPVMCQET